MPETVNTQKRDLFYEKFGAELVSRFIQADLLSEHDLSGLCFGLAFDWIRRKVRDEPVLSQLGLSPEEERRIRFMHALGNLQRNIARARKLPTGLAKVNWNAVNFDGLQNATHTPVHLHPRAPHRGRPSQWQEEDLEQVVNDFQDQLRSKEQGRRIGYMTPIAKKEGLVAIYFHQGRMGTNLGSNLDLQSLQFLVANPGSAALNLRKLYTRPLLIGILDSLDGIKSSFSRAQRPAGVLNRTLFMMLGLTNPGISAHAFGISINVKTDLVRIFDPNLGEFRFQGLASRFYSFLTLLLNAFYAKRGYSEFEMDWYDAGEEIGPYELVAQKVII